MVIKTSKGMFQVIKNTKNAFDLSTFENKYIEECFDMYPYIVGDISSNILRLKGFSEDSQAPNYYKNIEEYIFDSCAFRCPVFVLKRINTEEEYLRLEKKQEPVDLGEEKKFTLVKENFDKETLTLESTPPSMPNIVIDMNKINSIPKHVLPADLEAIKQQEEIAMKNQQNNRNNNRNNNFNNNQNNRGQNNNKPQNNNSNNNKPQNNNNNNKQQNNKQNPNNYKNNNNNNNNRPNKPNHANNNQK